MNIEYFSIFVKNSRKLIKDKILELLAAKFADARKDGLNQLARSLAVQCGDETEAQALVEKLTNENVNAFIKEWRADVDREVSEAGKKIEARLTKAAPAKTEEAKTDTAAAGSDIAALVAKAIAEAVKPLQERIDTYEADNVGKSRLGRLNDVLTGCKDEAYKSATLRNFGRMRFDDEDGFNSFISETQADIEQANQGIANAALASVPTPFKAGANSSPEDDFCAAMKAINKPKE